MTDYPFQNNKTYSWSEFLKKGCFQPLVFFILLLLLSIVLNKFASNDIALRVMGKNAKATITNRYITKDPAENQSKQYYIFYEFSLPDQYGENILYNGQYNSNSSRYYYPIGNNITIKYLEKNPKINGIPSDLILTILLVFFTTISFLFAILCLKIFFQNLLKALKSN